jgi:hypothetical protein
MRQVQDLTGRMAPVLSGKLFSNNQTLIFFNFFSFFYLTAEDAKGALRTAKGKSKKQKAKSKKQ